MLATLCLLFDRKAIVPGASTNTEASQCNQNSGAEVSAVAQILHFLVTLWRGDPFLDCSSMVRPAVAQPKHALCNVPRELETCASAHSPDYTGPNDNIWACVNTSHAPCNTP